MSVDAESNTTFTFFIIILIFFLYLFFYFIILHRFSYHHTLFCVVSTLCITQFYCFARTLNLKFFFSPILFFSNFIIIVFNRKRGYLGLMQCRCLWLCKCIFRRLAIKKEELIINEKKRCPNGISDSVCSFVCVCVHLFKKERMD